MDFAKDIVPIRIEDEMRNSYMDYSMSVIIGRALPDVRDGLKPVHRRILYAMHQEGLVASKKHSKCAGVVGEVLKKYHPHGDSAVYDALVRMAQPWNLRYLLVDGQGNFGSVDGDPAAAYRYTECRMTKLAEEMLVDIEKETVDFGPNFDGTTEEPEVLPSRFPNLLVNGADGIAVGMATKIPPHNLGEVIDACVALIETPDIGIDGLMQHIQGPDFPTAGWIYGLRGVREAYETGRGRVVVRGNAQIEDMPGGRQMIVIDEIPYQVNKARLIEQIAELVKDRRLEGISALRDESDRHGMRIVVELKKDVFAEVVLNHLYKHTALQSTFGVIMLAIVNQQPRVLTLKEMLQLYLSHRREVILRRTRFELREARARAHILEGFKKALDHLDEIISLIRAAGTPAEARQGLIDTFDFSALQADAILEMRLQRLTGMERQKILDELAAILIRIAELESILASESKLMGVVKAELLEIRAQYADDRRTRIERAARGDVSIHDLVAEEDQVVTLSHAGYIKRCSPSEWRVQARGGMGKQGMNTREEDFVTSLFIANTHAMLMVFTSQGRVYPLPVVDVPEAGRAARGRPIVNLVPVDEGERIASVVTVRDLPQETGTLLFVSRLGMIKRTPLEDFRNLRQGGLIAAVVDSGDHMELVYRVEESGRDVILFTRNGQCIRFRLEANVRELSRASRGTHGIELIGQDEVVDALLVPPGPFKEKNGEAEAEAEDGAEAEGAEEETAEAAPATEESEVGAEATEGEGEEVDAWAGVDLVLTVTTNGYGKLTPLASYPTKKRRYGKGVIAMDRSRGAFVVGAELVHRDDQIMLATDRGRVIRIPAREIRVIASRSSQGVRLMRLEEGERIVDFARLQDDEAAVDVPPTDGAPPDGAPPEAESAADGGSVDNGGPIEA